MLSFRKLIGDTGKPLGWSLVAVMFASGALGCLIGVTVLGSTAAMLSGATGLILGSIAGLVPMRTAVRLIAVDGGLLMFAAVMAVLSHGRPVVGAVTMVVLAFVCAVWSSLPIVGPIISTFPVLIFVVILVKEAEFVGDGSLATAAGATLAGILGAMLVAVIRSIRDPGKARRGFTAAAWNPATPFDQHATLSRMLLLDGAPRVQQVLAAQGTLVCLIRNYLQRQPDMAGDPRAAQADANSKALAAAIAAPGRPVPRHVSIDVSALTPTAAEQSGGTNLAVVWELLADSQQRASEFLAGTRAPQGWRVRPLLGIGRGMLKALGSPDASVYRYAIQRAAALGLGVLAIGLTNGNQSAYWITLTLASVLQISAPTTAARVGQRAVGTFVGVLIALAIAAVLPASVLMPWGALLLLSIALLWSRRSYAVQNVFMAPAMVLIYGVPDGQVASFAVLRAIDVIIGGLIALAVVKLVLPVRPRPAARRQQFATALHAFDVKLRDDVSSGHQLSAHVFATQASACDVARSNYATDIALLPSDQQPPEQERLAKLERSGQDLLAIATVVAGLAETPTHDSAAVLGTLERIDRRVVGEAAGS